jgi:hypothetical protein
MATHYHGFPVVGESFPSIISAISNPLPAIVFMVAFLEILYNANKVYNSAFILLYQLVHGCDGYGAGYSA